MQPRLRLSQGEKGGLGALLAGVATVLAVRVCGVEAGFWQSYSTGFRVIGWTGVALGAAWVILQAMRSRLHFFDIARRLDAEHCGVSMAAVALAVVIALIAIVPRLPATDASRLPSDPATRELVLNQERHLRYFVSAALVLTGAALAAFPATRFLRK